MRAQSEETFTRGTKEEQRLFHEVNSHLSMAKQDLETRISRKNGFDDADKLFNNFIDESKDRWPYQAVIFDPRVSTALNEKDDRLIASKPKGRLNPREGGDELGAHVNNELLSFQWDEVSRVDEPMVAKIKQLSQYARRYGLAFGIAPWRYETRAKMEGDKAKRKVIFDGPFFKVIDPRNCLPNPSYSYVKNWFQYREFVTFNDLKNVNDASRGEPKYKNMDMLQDALQKDESVKGKGGDKRSTEYTIKSKSIRGLNDFLGDDWVFKTIEIVTEMRPDRWITFAPRHGVILRDIPNPYDHGEIPVVMLRYHPLGDDLYGFSEIEQVSKLQKAINALICQYMDTVNTDLYPPVMVDSTRVQMNTLEFGPNAKWLVSGGDPRTAIQRLETSTAATNNFTQAYSLLVASLQNALGETSAAFSNLKPFGQERTATEIRETSFTKTVRDNADQIFLSEAIKRITMLWFSMNQQFLFQGNEKTKVIRIVGKDALQYFQDMGLDDVHPTEVEAMNLQQGDGFNEYNDGEPIYPVEMGDTVIPKLNMDLSGQGGDLHIEPSDLLGSYDYIPDIESMQSPSTEQQSAKLQQAVTLFTNPQLLQLLMQQGDIPKIKDILVKLLEVGDIIKDADQYFTQQPTGLGGVPGGQPGMPPAPLEQGGMVGQEQAIAPGAGAPQAGFPPLGVG